MRRIIMTVLVGVFCLGAGLVLGIFLSPELKWTQPGQCIASLRSNMPWTKAATDSDSPFEMYDYPTVKWRAKPLNDAPGAIAQLWTTYDWADEKHQSGGIMKYRLTMFKAPEKHECQVQLLDKNGFKITAFDVSDFFPTPGAPEIMEARDSHSLSESEYKRVRDYSIR
jgi:hypothetical protein